MTRIELPPLCRSFGRTIEGRYLELWMRGCWNIYDAKGELVRPLNAFENRLVCAAIQPPAVLPKLPELAAMTAQRDDYKAHRDNLQARLNDMTAERDKYQSRAMHFAGQVATYDERIDRLQANAAHWQDPQVAHRNAQNYWFNRGLLHALATLQGRVCEGEAPPAVWGEDLETWHGRYRWFRRDLSRVAAACCATWARFNAQGEPEMPA